VAKIRKGAHKRTRRKYAKYTKPLIGRGFTDGLLVGIFLSPFMSLISQSNADDLKHPENHPQCTTPYGGMPCPADCPNRHRFDGCHVCDCLRGKKGARGKKPQVASTSGATKKKRQ
jgi:hypothetical protein